MTTITTITIEHNDNDKTIERLHNDVDMLDLKKSELKNEP
jgi:hypothetical protein